MTFIVNIGDKPQIFVHAYNLGTQGRTYQIGYEADAIDVTAFVDTARRKIIGNHTVTMRYDGLFDSANSHLFIRDVFQNKRLISVWPSGATASATGAAIATAFAQQYRPAGAMGEVLSLGFDIVSDAQFDTVYAYDGVIATSTTGQYTSPTYDLGTPNPSGGMFFVHVIACSASGGNTRWTLRWQDSTADISGSFNAVSGINAYQATTATSTTQSMTGTTFRYHRFRASLDADSGNIQFLAGFGIR